MTERKQWKKGNGILLLGTVVMLAATFFTMMSIQIFVIRQDGMDTQAAADSIADGTAVHMSFAGKDYGEAKEKAEEIRELIEKETGVELAGYTLDEDSLSDNQVRVTAFKTDGYISRLHAGNSDAYTIHKTAVTDFTWYGAVGAGVEGALEWAEMTAADDSIGYIWGAVGPSAYDCSGFVGHAYLAAGIFQSPNPYCRFFTTATERGYLLSHGFTDVTASCNLKTGEGMLPGDILLNSHHTELYYGNGMQIGAHGRYGRTLADQISIFPLYQDWTSVYRYTGE